MKFLFTSFLVCMSVFSFAQKTKFIKKDTDKKIDVMIDNQLFTSYFYPNEDVLKKAVLYPIYTANGTTITRGWPLDPRPGERVDHPHHVGMWFNYEDVNGDDFWNNSNTPPRPTSTYGTIIHTGFKKINQKKGLMTVTADWLSNSRAVVLKEETTFKFYGKGKQRFIERTSTLTAQGEKVVFKDVKDGMIALRVARELEHPSTKAEIFTDAAGVATKVPALDNTGISGNYLNSNGIKGDDVWGKRANWVNLRGQIKDEKISVVIFDHPKNVGYPTYWHARGYGLFAANPLGQNIFSEGKENLNLTLKPGESVTFKYKIMIAGELTEAEIKAEESQFAGQ
jgi:Methane oxygenase PmoA